MNTPCRRRAVYANRKESGSILPIIVTPSMSVETDFGVVIHGVKSINPKACTKCGKVCERGLYMHMKHCKG
jgi:hypothetical protein